MAAAKVRLREVQRLDTPGLAARDTASVRGIAVKQEQARSSRTGGKRKNADSGPRMIALLGYPLAHSVSPALQQVALDYYCLPIRYEARETSPAEFGAAVECLKPPECLGANVTVPYKEAILPLCTRVEETASGIGAVNTVVNRRGYLWGYNTDVRGFAASLAKEGAYDPFGDSVVLLGAGGAARAVVAALAQAKAARITLANRDMARADTLAAEFARLWPGTEYVSAPLGSEKLASALRECGLLVNATSVGTRHTPTESQSPLDLADLSAEALVFDLVYNPSRTRFLTEAQARGNRTVSGLAMLVYQGAQAFELWTGKKAPIGLMMARAAQALEKVG